MKPELGVVFGLRLHTYGFAIALGFALGVVLAVREARRRQMDVEAMLDLLFWLLMAGLLGSRLLFVLVHAREYVKLCAAGDWLAPLRIWEGGLVFHGGVAGAAVAVWRFARKQRRPFAEVTDLLTPPLALGHAFGRLGCFFAGCCYGKPWVHGVSFPPGSVAADEVGSTPLHPTQLYESLGEIAIFFLLSMMRRRLRFHGQTTVVYALSYGVLRFGLEFLRGDAGRGFLLPHISTAQVVSVAMVLAALAVLIIQRARRRPAP